MFELHTEMRARQDIDDRIRRARHRRLVARVKASRPRPDRLA
ncbi:MAG: hypothetical protein NTX33_04115 [Propionibacteriales bacterium]|nr:hypothetical protein [Propionibacteriales bacterium]